MTAPLIAVVARRLRVQFRSAVWCGASILMAVVFAAAAARSIRLFDIDRAVFEEDQAQHAEELSRYPQTYSQIGIPIDRAPATLRLLLRGSEDAFAVCVTTYGRFRPTAFRGRDSLSAIGRGSLLLDPAAVLAVIGSLLALVLAVSSVVREREEGTLQLTLTYPCRRATVLLGEHLATLITVSIPMTVCAFALLAFAAATQRLSVDGAVLVQLLQVLALTLLVASAFAACGLLVATAIRSAPSVLSIAFAVWVLLVFLYPLVLPAMVTFIRPVELSPTTVAAAGTLAEYDLTPPSAATTSTATDDLRSRLAQADLHDRLAVLSPLSLYMLGVEGVTGTGTDGCRAFLERVLAIDAQFRRWQDDKLTRYPGRAMMYDAAAPPLDIDGLPAAAVAQPTRSPDVTRAVFVLLIWNALFTVAAQILFARYDARS